MDQLNLKAMGKINLALDVIGRRPDGYHEVRMIMQTVKVFDRITLKKSDEPGIRLTTNLNYLPSDRSNLMYQAASMLMEEFGITAGLDMTLQKYIPVAAGMAGGSTDAATVLHGVNKMFGLGLSRQQLMERAVRIGADVPYCLLRGTALSEGIGEVLTRLPAAPACSVIIAKPAVSVSTKQVYTDLDARPIAVHPDIDGMTDAIRRQDYDGMIAHMGNVLEPVTAALHPEVTRIQTFLLAHGADGAMMSGSGPTVFGLFREEAAAKEAFAALKAENLARQLYLTGFFDPSGRS